MKILLTPRDIIERCLWDNYYHYILDNNKEVAAKMIKENLEFELSERDALVIGLIKVIITDNFVKRFNDYINHFLELRSIKEESGFVVKKKQLMTYVGKFMNKFPAEYEPVDAYKRSLIEVGSYSKEIAEELEQLPVSTYVDKSGTHEVVSSNLVKKCLKVHV